METKLVRECDIESEWLINSANSDANCFERNSERRNTSACNGCPYDKKRTMIEEAPEDDH